MIKEKLYAFLKKNRAFTKFKTNYNVHKGGISIDDLIDIYVNEKRPDSIIYGAFIWIITPEGPTYWDNLSKLWQKECKE